MRRRLHLSTTALPVALTAPMLALMLALGLTGCGSEPVSKATADDGGALKCRDQWAGLAKVVDGRDEADNPSALPERWNSVIATIGYYASTASKKDCGANFDNQQAAIVALQDFGVGLRPWDMPWQLERVAPKVKDYLAEPLPRLAPPKKGKKAPVAPAKARVQQAYASLTQNAPLTLPELAPGWQQVNQVDLGDKARIASAKADLDVLARNGPHFQACVRALRVISAALGAGQNGGVAQ